MPKPKAKAPRKPVSPGDERLLAAICHVAIFFFPIFLSLFVWLFERNKEDFSEYIVFHAKQALVYQLLVCIVFFGLGIFLAFLSFILVGFLLLPAYFLLLLAALVYAGYGGIQCLMGRDFHYYFISDKIREWQL